MNRLFVFGCSYTNYAYPTWADIISVNFDQYYNYGRAGACNTYIMNKVIAVDDKIGFNRKTDTVIIMLTGFGRFSYLPRTSGWITPGDLYNYNINTKDHITTHFYDNMWSDNWAVYQSWIATKVIKNTLLSKKIKHYIVMGINNDSYINGSSELDDAMYVKALEIYNFLDNKTSLDKWKEQNNYYESEFWENIKAMDGHPSMNVYFQYAKDFFPAHVTRKSHKFLKYWHDHFDHRSQHDMGQTFNNLFKRQHDLALTNPMI